MVRILFRPTLVMSVKIWLTHVMLTQIFELHPRMSLGSSPFQRACGVSGQRPDLRPLCRFPYIVLNFHDISTILTKGTDIP